MLRTATIRFVSSRAITRGSPVLRTFSSKPDEGFFSRIKNTVTGGSSTPSATKQDAKYAEQISQMANAESWTLLHFNDQIKEATGGWRSMIPGMGRVDAIKKMRETQKLLEAAMDIVGSDAGAKELKEIGKKEKLKISLKSGAELKDINALVSQFESMDIMHRVLRYRVENGKPLPVSEEDAKNIMQNDVKYAFSEREMKDMQRQRMKLMKNRKR